MSRQGTSMLRLDDKYLQLSTMGRTQDTDGIQCFAELATTGTSSIFLDQVIESAAPHNAIVMELDLVQLRLALKSILGDGGAGSGGAGGPTVLKLAKRGGHGGHSVPCLCLDAVTPGSSAVIQIHHAVPVRVCRHQDMLPHTPPPHAIPDVQLELISSNNNNSSSSSMAPLRTIVEKLKPLSPVVYLEGNSVTGELTVSAYQDGASVQAFFSKLTPRQTRPASTATANSHKTTATVKMDTKKLWAALQGLQHSSYSYPSAGGGGGGGNSNSPMASQAVLCLVENEMVVLHVNLLHGVGFYTYYVPVHFLHDDDEDDNERR